MIKQDLSEKYLKNVVFNRCMEATTQKLLYFMDQINNKLDKIEVEVREIKDELSLEVRPEYVEKLKKIEKKRIVFKKKEDFLNYLHNEI